MNEFVSWCRHLLVSFLFHALTSLHPPLFHRNDFSTCIYITTLVFIAQDMVRSLIYLTESSFQGSCLTAHGRYNSIHPSINIVLTEQCFLQHEKASVMMLDHLIEANDLMGEMRKYGLDENDLTFIKELIVGQPQNTNETPNRNVYKSLTYTYLSWILGVSVHYVGLAE